MECIVLAGGLGTRLRGTIGDYPKCMAEVNGKPFLHYIFQYLESEGCKRVVLSLGYKHEIILNWINTQNYSFEIAHVIEDEPLGTGGGIQLAIKEAKGKNILVLNGDTMFQVALADLLKYHELKHSETTLALKEMHAFERYGVVKTDDSGIIVSFEEKQKRQQGWINGGIYVIDKTAFVAKNLPEKFSFEKDYLEAFVQDNRFAGFKADGYFIDIGIPEDYQQAQEDFKTLFA